MKPDEKYINWTQLTILVAGAIAGLILTAFGTFATKESVANEFSLRSQARTTELTQMRSDIAEIRADQKKMLEVMNDIRRNQ